MKQKILIALNDSTEPTKVFSELKPLLNESHKKYITGIRLGDYLEQKLVLSSVAANNQNGKDVSRMLNLMQSSLNLEEAASDLGMEFQMHHGELDDDALCHLSAVADLLIIDRQILSPFCGEDILADLVSSVHCPVLVLPSEKEVQSLLMVYDGSFSSIQALKSFLALFHPNLRELPFSVLVSDPESKKDMDKEKVFIDYIKLFFEDIGVMLMDDDTVSCLSRVVAAAGEKPLLLFGGQTGESVLKCHPGNRQITDNNPSFIHKGEH